MATTRARGGFRYIGSERVITDIAELAARTADTTTTVNVSGCKTTDVAACSPSIWTAGIVWDAYVSAQGVVTCVAHNYTAGAINAASTLLNVVVYRPDR
jgi:hypothetical protein